MNLHPTSLFHYQLPHYPVQEHVAQGPAVSLRTDSLAGELELARCALCFYSIRLFRCFRRGQPALRHRVRNQSLCRRCRHRRQWAGSVWQVRHLRVTRAAEIVPVPSSQSSWALAAARYPGRPLLRRHRRLGPLGLQHS
jgi:hypothetical protein